MFIKILLYVSTTREEDSREWRNVIFAKHTITGKQNQGDHTFTLHVCTRMYIVDHTSLIVGGYSVLRLNYQVEDRACFIFGKFCEKVHSERPKAKSRCPTFKKWA